MTEPRKGEGPLAQPDLAHADRFLTLLDEQADCWYFRTIHPVTGAVRNYAGSLRQRARQLQADNAAGFGVFVVVNEGGTLASAITRVRAVFAEFDPPATAAMPADPPLEPHMVVESSRGKHHAYWLVDGLPVHEFKATQQAIIAAHGADPQVCDLPRVMRLPGFLHTKPADPAKGHDGRPFLTHIFHESGAVAAYTAEAIRAAWPATRKETPPAAAQAAPVAVVDTERHGDARRVAAHMAALVVADGMEPASAWAAVVAERDRGRYTRPMDDAELRRLFDGAVGKYRSGEWTLPAFARAMPAAANEPQTGEYLDMTAVDVEPPERREVVAGMLPVGVPVLLAADGGVGKTLLSQQIATSVAAGIDWLGEVKEPGPVLAFYCEDPTDELHRRQRGINARLGIESGSLLAGRAFLQSRIGMDNALMGFDRDKNPIELPLLAYVEAEVARIRPKLVILDNLAQMVRGDLSDETHATTFTNRMAGIALRNECAVLMLAHTPKSGAEFFGSVAWNNAVRARLFMESETEPDPVNPKRVRPTGRVFLSRPKANWGKREGAVAMRWQADAFMLDGGPMTLSEAVERGNRMREVEQVVVDGITALLPMLVNTSEKPQAGNYLPKVLEQYQLAAGVSRKELGEALRRLIKAGAVLPGQEVWRRSNRSPVYGLAVVEPVEAEAA